jgi:hypothetical protein
MGCCVSKLEKPSEVSVIPQAEEPQADPVVPPIVFKKPEPEVPLNV